MKLALSNLAWNPADEEATVKLMHKYGFTGVELAPTKVWEDPSTVTDDVLTDYRRKWNDRGIEVVALQSLFYNKPNLRLIDGFDHLQKLSTVARTLGAEVMVLGSPKNRTRSDWGKAVGFFRRCADAEIPLCIEPNPPEYHCKFIRNTEEARTLMNAVGRFKFRLHLDSGIMSINGEKYIPPDTAHFHVSQPYLQPVGPGEVDHRTMANSLNAVSYKNWVSVEMLPCDDLERSLAYAAEIYQ